jgi:hypothetical protein
LSPLAKGSHVLGFTALSLEKVAVGFSLVGIGTHLDAITTLKMNLVGRSRRLTSVKRR